MENDNLGSVCALNIIKKFIRMHFFTCVSHKCVKPVTVIRHNYSSSREKYSEQTSC